MDSQRGGPGSSCTAVVHPPALSPPPSRPLLRLLSSAGSRGKAPAARALYAPRRCRRVRRNPMRSRAICRRDEYRERCHVLFPLSGQQRGRRGRASRPPGRQGAGGARIRACPRLVVRRHGRHPLVHVQGLLVPASPRTPLRAVSTDCPRTKNHGHVVRVSGGAPLLGLQDVPHVLQGNDVAAKGRMRGIQGRETRRFARRAAGGGEGCGPAPGPCGSGGRSEND